ncbi:RNA-directed DNA polymerase [Bordetella trematum]|uniref:retron Ec67 family RNA-directed DNA polymerase/endonuclease n=1 Tax=Bordetella trematum TaxID=123899 RepID=UPI0014055657|nr:retron Ec67 family RNA-directed DNA polymerase/endonuclease [Bordetella trematum]QIM72985.1 RNA-directed DNA polymerase [Bordetella trematum]
MWATHPPPFMTQLKKLKAAKDIYDISTLLNYKAGKLSYILYVIDESDKYSSFEIPKKGGGTRTIKSPIPKLKRLQKNLSNLLQNCLDELRSENSYVDPMSHGFEKKRNIITNAEVHRAKRYIFNIDIKDFFGSINFGRVRGFFIKDNRFELDPKIATIIAQICCHENSLPQGSPCSPVISNIIGHILDVRLLSLAIKNGCSYTRYADDITFSTNKKKFPSSIAAKDDDGHGWSVGKELSDILKTNKFSENKNKTRMQYKTSRQSVTGLVVNKKINVRSEYRKQVRAMVHSLFSKGTFFIPKAGVAPMDEFPEGTLNQLHGMLGFIDSIDQNNVLRQGLEAASITQKEKTYRKFLLYKDFYLSTRPIILCEGKTDNIYLKCAIKSLAGQHQLLGERVGVDSFKMKVRFYKYAETSTGRILGLSGGTGDFPKFINSYLSGISKFTALELNHPVIMIIDNDSGAKGIYSKLREILNRQISPAEEYIYAGENLYIVPTPIAKHGQHSMIEDCFDKDTKKILVDGKKFNPDDKASIDMFYGKSVFATQVIERFSEKINFNGFSVFLSRIESAINHFHNMKG